MRANGNGHLSEGLRKKLLEAKNYREFLQTYCNKKIGGVSYSTLASRAGFSSRAHVRETVLGKRRMTLSASLKFVSGMKLSTEWQEYFKYLLALDYPEFLPNRNQIEIQDKLKLLSIRLKQSKKKRRNVLGRPDLADQILRIPHFPLIYAAIGIEGEDITIEKISTRTGLETNVILSSLKNMANLGLIVQTKASVRPLENHLALSEAGRSVLARELFISSLKDLRRASELDFESKEKLFHQSFFCVQKSMLTKLKKELNETILEFVSNSLDPDGDHVVQILVGFK
jgi:uncharacterized protein (TIGR02147 family)